LSLDGEDPASENEERGLTFVGAPKEEGDDGETTVEEEGEADSDDDEPDNGENRIDRSMLKMPSETAVDILTQKSPVLYRVEDTTALSSTPLTSVSRIVAPGSTPTWAPSTPRIAEPVLTPVPPPTDVTTGRTLSPAVRFEALLWELLARLSRRTLDTVVANWQPSVAPDEFFVTKGVEDAIDSLFRTTSSQEVSLGLLSAMSEEALLDYAASRVVSLGNVSLQVKRGLRRPRRKADSAV